MDLRTYRKEIRELTLEAAAREIGCSVGHLSGVETGEPASATLGLAIEKWSEGNVAAEQLSPDVARVLAHVQAAAA